MEHVGAMRQWNRLGSIIHQYYFGPPMGQQLTGIQQCAIHLPDDSLKHTLWQEETVSQLVNHEIK